MATQDKNEGVTGPLAKQFAATNANDENKKWGAEWAPKVEAAQKKLAAAKGSGKGTKPAWDAWVEEQKVQLAKAEAKPVKLPEDEEAAAAVKFNLFKKTNGNDPVPDPGPFSDGGSGMTADILKDIMILKVRVKDPSEPNKGALEKQLAEFEEKLAVAQAEYDAAFNKLAKTRNCMNCGCSWGLTFILLGGVVFAAALVFTFFPVYMQVFTWPWYEIACWAWAILGLTMLFLGCFCFCCGKSKEDNAAAAREIFDDGEVRAPIPYVMLDP